MKFFEPNENRTTVAVYIFLVALFGVLCIMLGMNIGLLPTVFGFVIEIIKPILYGFVFAFILHPFVAFMENTVLAGWKKPKDSVKHTLSIVIVFVLFILLIALFCVAVIPEVINNYDKFASQLVNFADNFQTRLAEIINRFSGADSNYVYFDSLPEYRKSVSDDLFVYTLGNANGLPLKTTPNTVLKQVQEIFRGLISAVTGSLSVSGVFTSAMAVITAAKNIIIGLMISVYFLAGEKKIVGKINRTARAWLPRNIYRRLMWLTEKINDIFRSYIMVRLVDAFIVGFLNFFVLFIFRTPYVMLLSIIVGIASFFPFIGPVIGIATGSVIILIADISYLPIFLIVSIALNVLDAKYIEPLLGNDEKSTNLSAIWVYTAIVIMGGLFGVGGVVFGIPLTALIYSIVKEVSEKHLKRKHLPVDTADYFIGYAIQAPSSTNSEATDEDAPPPDMETYFAEKHEEELETSRNLRAALAEKLKYVKKFFIFLGRHINKFTIWVRKIFNRFLTFIKGFKKKK